MSHYVDRIDAAVDHVLAHLPGEIVLGLPLGIGKPNPFVNALYRRIAADPSRRLKIFTALSLNKPQGRSELEQRFLAPFVARVFGDYPDLDYVADATANRLPENIEVHEFFFKTGDYLKNATAQQNYVSTNYTFVARDMLLQGVNLLAQAVAARPAEGRLQLSLSCNTDVTEELVERLRSDPARRFLTVAVVNEQLPFMTNSALVPPDFFDLVVTDPAATHHLFGAPNMKVSSQDYAIGLLASTLVADGGTLQIGIGALGDAIAQALILRQQHNAAYGALLDRVTFGGTAPGQRGPFTQGLYGCSEMLVNGFLRLLDAGVVRRSVYADTCLQTLLNRGEIDETVSPATLSALHRAGRIASPLRAADVDFLCRFGILREGVTWQAGALHCAGANYSADLDAAGAMAEFDAHLLGSQLRGGICLHGGFFLGPEDFYQRLRALPADTREKIAMQRIDFINQLNGHEALAAAQRQKACFINTTMMVTLLGAAVSDGLDNGAMVSGVGGQYNFVAMAHALPDARSILLLRATRESAEGVRSNIVWNYAHTTIPRHLRDIVVTEYGIADLRGQCDAEVIGRLIAVADSRFQDELVNIAQRHGKLPADFQLPAACRNNTPEVLEAALSAARDAALLPDFPFGTDFTADELAMAGALQKLKQASEHPLELLTLALRSVFSDQEAPAEWLERLGLAQAHDLKTLITRRLFVGNL